jgi:hypothetical protein
MGDPSHALSARRVLRVPRRAVLLRVDLPGERFLGYVADISETGAFIQCASPRSEGSVLETRLHLGRGSDRVMDCSVRVIWTRGYAGAVGPCPGMGVEFCEVDARGRELLRQLCAEAELVEQQSA